MKNYFIICGIITFLAAPAMAQSVSNATLVNDTFHEGYSQELNVSAGIILGLAIDISNGIASTKETFLNKGGIAQSKNVCVRISSIDGLFWAENNFKTEGNDELWRISPLSKKHSSKVKQYGSEGLIGLVKTKSNQADDKLGSTCESDTQNILIPLQSGTNIIPKNLTLYVNSSNRFTQVLLKSKSIGGTEPFKTAITDCTYVDFDIAAVFDQECTIEIPNTMYGKIVQVDIIFESPPYEPETWSENVAIPTYVSSFE